MLVKMFAYTVRLLLTTLSLCVSIKITHQSVLITLIQYA